MRIFTNSAMSVYYPEDLVFSGDLNLIEVSKNTTATFIEISFVINGYEYKENLYFYSNTVSFSMSEILALIFYRSKNTTFIGLGSFSFTIKLYNNTTLIDEESFSIANVLLGRRKVFDKSGIVPFLDYFEINLEAGADSIYFFWNGGTVPFYYKGEDGGDYYFGLITNGIKIININALAVKPLYFYYGTFDETFDETFQGVFTINYIDGCGSSDKKIGLRFLNRFGVWRYYVFTKMSELNNSANGISLDFLGGNLTEYSGLKTEQQKPASQNLVLIKENINKEILNDLADVISTDHAHIYDAVNSVWIPVRVKTNAIPIVEKEDLFDITLNVNLKTNE